MKTFDAGKPKTRKAGIGRRFLQGFIEGALNTPLPDSATSEDPTKNLPTSCIDEAGNHRNAHGGYNLIIKGN